MVFGCHIRIKIEWWIIFLEIIHESLEKCVSVESLVIPFGEIKRLRNTQIFQKIVIVLVGLFKNDVDVDQSRIHRLSVSGFLSMSM
jgi:hypothetical protein